MRPRAGKAATVVLAVLAVLVLGLLCCGGLGYGGFQGVYWYAQQAEPYQLGMAAVHADEEVVHRIGEPMEPQLPFTFSVDSSGGEGSASYSVPLEGPLGPGTLAFTAEQRRGTWSLTSALFLDPLTDDSVDILARAQRAEQAAEVAELGARLEEGLAAQARGDDAAALAAFEALLAEDPENHEALLARGSLYRSQGHLDKAQADLERAAANAETAEDAWRELGAIHHDRGEWQPCVDAYTEVLKEYADDGRAWYGRARCYEALGELRRARAGAREACSLAVVEACAMADRL